MPSMRLAVTVAVLVALVLGVTLWVPWLKTPVLIALADGLAVTGVIVLIRAGQVSFGHAMYACLAGYGVAARLDRPAADGLGAEAVVAPGHAGGGRADQQIEAGERRVQAQGSRLMSG